MESDYSYLLDANFFIQAKKSFSPIDVFPCYWSKLKALADEGVVFSIDKVKQEIDRGNDSLTEWCNSNLPSSFFRSTATTECLLEYQNIIQWANSNDQFSDNAKNVFSKSDEADAFLIAYTKANAPFCKLVTYEKSSPQSRNNIKIPDACNENNTLYIEPLDMFREIRETF